MHFSTSNGTPPQSLDAQLRILKTQCAEEEFQVYLCGFGYVLGYMFTEIMTPIYAEHPDASNSVFYLRAGVTRGHPIV